MDCDVHGYISLFVTALEYIASGWRDDKQIKAAVHSDKHLTPLCRSVLSESLFFSDEPWIARWDADRYLQRSFSYLMFSLHPQPDVIVLLGDVFSNGFVATDRQWEDYLKVINFNNIAREG